MSMGASGNGCALLVSCVGKPGAAAVTAKIEMVNEFEPVKFWIRLDDGRTAEGVLMPMRMQ